MITFLLVLAVMFFFLQRTQKKARERAESTRDNALQVGKNVMTASGFLGTIVDIDGDVVTLQSPSGEETAWVKEAIAQEKELPLAFDDIADEEYSAAHSSDGATEEENEENNTKN